MNEMLAARVKAVNRANEYAGVLYQKLVEVFQPLVGQPVLKADGQLFKKIVLPELANKNSLSVYRLDSKYSLAWVVKTCEYIEVSNSCVYHDTTVYVGSIDGNVLTGILSPPNEYPAYTVEQVVAARNYYKDLKKIADEAKDALYPFGEYDR